MSVFIAQLSERQDCWRFLEDFHSQESFQFSDIHCVLFMRLHFTLVVMTVVGLLDVVEVSISASSKSFLLIMCIDALDSATNSLSSGSRVDGAGKHQFSECEKNVPLFISFKDIFGQPPRCCVGTLFLPHSLLWRPILNFWSVGVALMRFTWANQSERRILVSNFSVTCNSFREFYTLDWFLHV